MLLPNGDKAVVDDRKLLQYILSPTHPHGRSHARLFDQLLGINLSNATILRESLLQAAKGADAIATELSKFGQKYEIRFSLAGPRGSYNVLSVWMIGTSDPSRKLVTAYVDDSSMNPQDTYSELDLVALVQSIPEHNLPVGQTGTIVMIHNAGEAFEIEFPLTPRKSVVATIKPEQIIKLKGLTIAPAV